MLDEGDGVSTLPWLRRLFHDVRVHTKAAVVATPVRTVARLASCTSFATPTGTLL